jgi:hypothetical protein
MQQLEKDFELLRDSLLKATTDEGEPFYRSLQP